MKIYIAIHGESTGDVENRYGGRYDDELTEKGVSQAKDLAKKLSKKEIKFIFSSPLKRAEKTAEIIGEELKVEVDIIDNLRERNQYGPLSGLTKTEAKEEFADEIAKLKKHRYNTFVTGSEYYKRFTERLFPTFEKLLGEFENNNILLVTHGGPIRALLREYFKAGEIDSVGDCMLVEIEKTGEEFKIINIDGAIIVSKEEAEKAFREKQEKIETTKEQALAETSVEGAPDETASEEVREEAKSEEKLDEVKEKTSVEEAKVEVKEEIPNEEKKENIDSKTEEIKEEPKEAILDEKLEEPNKENSKEELSEEEKEKKKENVE